MLTQCMGTLRVSDVTFRAGLSVTLREFRARQ